MYIPNIKLNFAGNIILHQLKDRILIWWFEIKTFLFAILINSSQNLSMLFSKDFKMCLFIRECRRNNIAAQVELRNWCHMNSASNKDWKEKNKYVHQLTSFLLIVYILDFMVAIFYWFRTGIIHLNTCVQTCLLIDHLSPHLHLS